MLKKFRFHDNNLALDFKIFENMRPLSVYLEQHLTLILELFQVNLNR
jgi:hypothetical protein